MFKNYVKIAFRNLIKNKSQTIINVGGLTLGVICALIIFLVVQYDLSFDKWHTDGDRVYRLVRTVTEFGTTEHDEGGPYPMAETVEKEISGIEFVSLVDNNYSNTPVISYFEDGKLINKFKNDWVAFVEPEYFSIFDYTWLAGDPKTALANPNSVVLTESYAIKMFGSLDAIGKELVLSMGSTADFVVTGLVKDPPETSDFPFTFIGSSASQNREGQTASSDNWSANSTSLQTFIKLLPGTDPASVESQISDMYIKYRNENGSSVTTFTLQPLSDIHFNSTFGNYSGRVVEKRTLFALGIIGLFLLITACINFVNLNTAIAVSRSKEVGLRKTLGGTKLQLTFHFLGETAFVTLLSIVLGIGLSEVILQKIEPLLGFTPELQLTQNLPVLLFLGILFLLITFSAGWYPARYLSGFSPIEAIRNKINASYGQGLTLRRSLIVIQFTITQILIIGTIVIGSQVRYFQTKDLGFEKEALINIDIPSREKQTIETFKNRLLNESSIINVAFSNTGTTSGNVWGGNYKIYQDTTIIENDAQIKFADADFLDTYGINLLAGSNITESDTVNSYLVSESLAKQAGFAGRYQELIGLPMTFWGFEATVSGVFRDFNTTSLHSELEPVVIATRRNSYYQGGIKINTQATSAALASIERIFNDAFPESIFEYEFLDEKIANMYFSEQRTGRIMNAFTVIAILIGCLGLFGLVSYMATTRTKEIGVRKVLGANLLDILKIFGTELGILTGISFLIAAPISWYLMQRWLEDFAYKIELGLGIFALALAGTLVVAALTVSYKALSAALANPVDSLKSE